ncbi:MAG: AraC family transcriptional regulator [Bacteroidota bacterium]
MLSLNADRLSGRPLETLVENRTTFTLDTAALNLFETHQEAAAVHLRFDQPVLASMIEGRKVMHLRKRPGFNFLPGESVILPPEELMVIDFPDARDGRPTKCLALEIDPDIIKKVTVAMNEERPRTDNFTWERGQYNLHFKNDPGVTQLIQRLVYLCAEDHPAKDLFVNMSLKELLIRLLELESRQHHLEGVDSRATSQPITAAVAYILGHLDEKLTVASLSKVAYMSESSFFRAFKNEMGVSPVEFVNSERIKLARSLLRRKELSMCQIAMRCGFNSPGYFTRMFKKYLGVSPQRYQEGLRGNRK